MEKHSIACLHNRAIFNKKWNLVIYNNTNGIGDHYVIRKKLTITRKLMSPYYSNMEYKITGDVGVEIIMAVTSKQEK